MASVHAARNRMLRSRTPGFGLATAAVIVALLASADTHARCNPATEPDASDVAAAREAVAAHCDCTGAATHGAYVRCAVQ